MEILYASSLNASFSLYGPTAWLLLFHLYSVFLYEKSNGLYDPREDRGRNFAIGDLATIRALSVEAALTRLL